VIDFLFAIIGHFSLALAVQSRYWSKSAFCDGVGHFMLKFHVEGGVAHQPLLMSEKQNDYPFIWCQNIGRIFFSFVTKHACDGQTEGQNYDPNTALASTAASRGKNEGSVHELTYRVQRCYIDLHCEHIAWLKYNQLVAST